MTGEAFRERMNRATSAPIDDETPPPIARPVVRSLADVEPRTVKFLWPGYIVRHKFNLIAGYGGVGKGQVMANLIARGSRGDPMPGEHVGTMFRTLILAAEDDAHEDIRPRLDANGANLKNIFIMDGVDTGDGDVRWVDIQKHIALVKQAVVENQIDLVYIDPLASYMPGVRRQNGGEVRDALGHLQRLINETSATVTGALHLGKEALNRRGAMKVLDSVEYVNASRNVIGVNDLPDEYQPEDVQDDADLGRHKILAVLKSNSMIPGPAMTWSRPRDAEVEWHGRSPITFDESFASAPPETAREGAADWLRDFLKGGMQPQTVVAQEGKAAGFSMRTLTRAKKEIPVKSVKTGNGPWYWKLPNKGDEPADDEDTTEPESKDANQGCQHPVHEMLAPLASLLSDDKEQDQKRLILREGSQQCQESQVASLLNGKRQDGQGCQQDTYRNVAPLLGILAPKMNGHAGTCACGAPLPPGRKWLCSDDCKGGAA